MSTLAYHFVGGTLRDGCAIPANGEWLEYEGVVRMCSSGLHASRSAFDALKYAPGATLCLVECDDIITEDIDKFVCRRRRILARFDATEMLWTAARKFAMDVVHHWNAPPIVMQYLKTGDETLQDAAESATRNAAWNAARSATRNAAWNAARSATRNAAWNAAWNAARNAAWSAAESAAWNTAQKAQQEYFDSLVAEKFANTLAKFAS